MLWRGLVAVSCFRFPKLSDMNFLMFLQMQLVSFLRSVLGPYLLLSVRFRSKIKTALHDGGMVIAQNRVAGAGCVFPVSSRELADRTTGLRHRAALGITEETDCVAVVVSEETGQISIAIDGKLFRGLSEDEFRLKMEAIFLPKEKNDEKDVEEPLAGETDDAHSRGDDLVSD